MRFMDLGAPELILIVLVLVLVFGASKLGEIGGALGKSVREFRKASSEDEPPATPAAGTDAPLASSQSPPPTAVPRVNDYRPPAGRPTSQEQTGRSRLA
jgi:sec-independent protein translocase protein TatA